MRYQIGDDELVSDAVVRAVSAVEGREPCSIEPLAGAIEPDALDALFSDQYDGTQRPGGRLSFVYSCCRVTVDTGESRAVAVVERLRENALTGFGSGDARRES